MGLDKGLGRLIGSLVAEVYTERRSLADVSLLSDGQLLFEPRSGDGEETLHAEGDVFSQFIDAMVKLR